MYGSFWLKDRYVSYVKIGQQFYSFGWESMLIEMGFLSIFLGSIYTPCPFYIILLLRWLLFRNIFGAGLIKIRGDKCWHDCTALDYHFETQPIPNAISWYCHQLPKIVKK